jgi:DNA-directed RNA polymerase subunit M/transcription elongation factor TFIIS
MLTLPGVFRNEKGNWCRTCKSCGNVVEHIGRYSRIACVNSTRNAIKCVKCTYPDRVINRAQRSYQQTKSLELEHSEASAELEKEYSLLSEGQVLLTLKTRLIECPQCGQRRMQTVPVEFTDFRFWCHKCNMRHEVTV